MKIAGYEVHPAAELFPMMSDDELQRLANDIGENGLNNPVVLYGGQLLDGRNRAKACEIAGEPMTWVEWEGKGDPVPWVVSQNEHRRHLTNAQRAIIAAKIREHYKPAAKDRQKAAGGDHTTKLGKVSERSASDEAKRPRSKPRISKSAEEAGIAMNVSRASVERAVRVVERGTQELVSAVESGKVSLTAACKATYDQPARKEEMQTTTSHRKSTIELDNRIKPLVERGLSIAQVANRLEIDRTRVQSARQRLGLVKSRKSNNPIDGLTKQAVEFGDAWMMLLDVHPAPWATATVEQRRACVSGLKRLVRMTKQLVSQLNKEAEGDEE